MLRLGVTTLCVSVLLLLLMFFCLSAPHYRQSCYHQAITKHLLVHACMTVAQWVLLHLLHFELTRNSHSVSPSLFLSRVCVFMARISNHIAYSVQLYHKTTQSSFNDNIIIIIVVHTTILLHPSCARVSFVIFYWLWMEKEVEDDGEVVVSRPLALPLYSTVIDSIGILNHSLY